MTDTTVVHIRSDSTTVLIGPIVTRVITTRDIGPVGPTGGGGGGGGSALTVKSGGTTVDATVDALDFDANDVNITESPEDEINLALTSTSVVSGSYGAADQVGFFRVNTKGRLTSASNTPIVITSASVTGLAAALATKISSGSATLGTDIAGSYPVIFLASTSVVSSSYGSATQVARVDIDAKGRVTSASNITITGTAPGGAAGGDLSGTYPSPSVVDDSHAHTAPTLPSTIVYDGDTAGGDLATTYPNPVLTSTSVVSGSYGTAANVGSFIVTAKGRLDSASNVPIQVAESQVTNLVTDLAGKEPTLAATGVTSASYGTTTQVGQFIVNALGRITSASNITISGTAPGGAAGGVDLSGTYPNPVLTSTSVVSASYGSATQVGKFDVDAKGRLTSASNVTITGTVPGGAAGGVDLSGTYPNPVLTSTSVVSNSYGTASLVPVFSVDAKGRLTSASTVAVAGGPPSGAAGGDLATTYPNPVLTSTSVVSASYGTATQVGKFSVDAKGRLTSASNVTIAPPASAVTADSTTLVGTGTDVQAVLEELDNGIADHLADASDAHDASAISVVSTTLVGTGTDAQAVFEELDNAIAADELDLANHIADSSAAHAAASVSADTSLLVGTGTNVQTVLEELDDGIANHLADTADAHAASAISILDTAANFTATEVEGALAELQSEKAPATNVQVFTASGTYTKPAGCAVVSVMIISAGAGGGSGRRGTNSTIRGGGGGGGGGGFSMVTFRAAQVLTTESVVVPAGGAGGAAPTSDNTNGNDGVSPAATTFGALMSVGVAAFVGGAGGTSAAGGGGGGAGNSGNLQANLAGGGGGNGTTAPTGAAAGALNAGGSGGGGGGCNAANSVIQAGAAGIGGGAGIVYSGFGAGGSTPGGAGGNGGASTVERGGGSGGGGGASGTVGGGQGGDAAVYGAGGGGGGGTTNGTTGGRGGNGSAGIVIVVST